MPNKKVVLVFPRFRYPSGDFSIGLAYIAGYLRDKINNLDLSILDTTFNPSLDYANKFLENKSPDIVGIYTDTLMFKDAIKIAKIAKLKGSTVLLGGPHPTIFPEETIKSKYVDAVCIGEGEEVFKEYIDTFYSDKKFAKVKGIWFNNTKGEIVKTNPKKPLEDLDKLSFPAYDLFDMDKYIKLFVQLDSYNPHLKGVSIIISRGCPYLCAYCQPTLKKIFGNKVRLRSPKKVIEELKQLKQKYNINSFYFQDDILPIFKQWVKKFCELMMFENLNLIWCCNTRADTADLEILKLMKKAGLVKIKIGIESSVDRIRNDIYKKGVSIDEIYKCLDICKKLKIQTTGFFMLGAPTEKDKEVLKTIWFAANSGLVEANFSITTPLPKTYLYNFVKKNGWNLPKDFSCFDYYDVKRPKMSKNEISIFRLKIYKKFAYLFFYFHPRRIISTIKAMISFRKLLLKLKRF